MPKSMDPFPAAYWLLALQSIGLPRGSYFLDFWGWTQYCLACFKSFHRRYVLVMAERHWLRLKDWQERNG